MNPRLLVLIVLTLSSCGLLGISMGPPDPVVTDPLLRAQVLDSYETPLSKYQDSLLVKIDAAKQVIPTDLAQTTLIIETHSEYQLYVRTFSVKYHRPDSARLKKEFLRYSKGIAKRKFLRNPKYKTVYADAKAIAALDPAQYRYALKATVRTNIDLESVTVHESGFVAPMTATSVYYLYDRQTGAVFREIKDLKVLEK
ncbi:MAG: hypothetical protein E6Q96_11285 [Cyclobacteriaceae bacterium]|nr:MAG: hypothetical protein E6Q96_11285 [Cyclobacteriaceae bacterium]